MHDSTIIEILLAVLALVVGYGSYLGAARAAKAQAITDKADVDAEAFDRAKSIYESAIHVLEGHISNLSEQCLNLDIEVTKLREANTSFRLLMIDLQVKNAQLSADLQSIKRGSTPKESDN